MPASGNGKKTSVTTMAEYEVMKSTGKVMMQVENGMKSSKD